MESTRKSSGRKQRQAENRDKVSAERSHSKHHPLQGEKRNFQFDGKQIATSKAPKGKVLTLEQHNVLDTLAMHRLRGSKPEGEMIPFYRSIFRKGTQNPTFRLKTALTSVPASAGGVINAVQFVSLGQVLGVGSWNDIFEEYRILNAAFVYVPHSRYAQIYGGTTGQLMSTGRTICSSVDYSNSTAATSKNQLWSDDTGKAWNTQDEVHFSVKISGYPDLEWVSTQTTGTVVATVKLYADGCVPSAVYGEIFGWIDVQFRQTGNQ